MDFSKCSSTFIGRYVYKTNRSANYTSIACTITRAYFEKEHSNWATWFEIDCRVRYNMKRLVCLWLYRRYKARAMNTEDPASLCVPVVPISMFDMEQRGMYIFELISLKKQMEAELCYAEWLFPEPRHPKNPFTNLEFTEAQRICILEQFRAHNIGSWILEAYRSVVWNLEEFKHIYHIPLKVMALGYLVRNPSSDETIEYVQDYILDEYNYHKLPNGSIRVSIRVLNWGVKNSYTSPYIQAWIKLFEEHSKASILFGDYEPTYEYKTKLRDFHLQSKLLFSETIQYGELKAAYVEALQRPPPLCQLSPNLLVPSPSGIDTISVVTEQLDDSLTTEYEEDESLPSFLREIQRIVVELPNGSIRVIRASDDVNRYQLTVTNHSSRIEDGSDSQV